MSSFDKRYSLAIVGLESPVNTKSQSLDAGVRARQEKVVFVACEDETVIQETVKPLLGEAISSSQCLLLICHCASEATNHADISGACLHRV